MAAVEAGAAADAIDEQEAYAAVCAYQWWPAAHWWCNVWRHRLEIDNFVFKTSDSAHGATVLRNSTVCIRATATVPPCLLGC